MSASDLDTAELFKTTVEANVRRRCHGTCLFCDAPYGGPGATQEAWEDLASWIFGHCSFRCRLAAGEPREFDMQRALAILFPDAS